MRKIVLSVMALMLVMLASAPASTLGQDSENTLDVKMDVWRLRTDGDSGNDGPCTVAMYPLLPTGAVASVSIGDPIDITNARQPGITIRDETGAIAAFWQVSDAKFVFSGYLGVRCLASHTFTLPTSHPYYTIWLDTEMVHMFSSDAPPLDIVSVQLQKGLSKPA